MRCESGAFIVPDGPGLGIEPNATLWSFLRKKAPIS
jgi:galactonate dehydratase